MADYNLKAAMPTGALRNFKFRQHKGFIDLKWVVYLCHAVLDTSEKLSHRVYVRG
ncbi:hypothetical protein [Nodularia sp. NIES-3585]|uniref:hypothetical protein n=1 Tax=Nodularia sp. NIES-3585 TaxID=1973477 RepID=UPI000B64C194|nr:hypothetical protein [Nodularia sp. NIES-3585]GAX35675.1 hypothetical protein NIES3585_16930 [Nodularia sp. NIES-3585]